MPLVSIAIPAYNHQNFVGDLLLSIKNQNLPDYEIVMVDDYSTDQTYHVAQSCANQLNLPLKLFRNSRNLGILKTISRVAALTSGKYLCLFNSDDVYVHNGLLPLLNNLEENPDVMIIYSNGTYLMPNGKLQGIILTGTEIEILKQGVQSTLFYLWSGTSRLFLQSTMMRNDFFRSIGGFPDNAQAEDWVLNIKIFEGLLKQKKNYMVLPENLSFAYRNHSSNTFKNLKYHTFKTVYTTARFVPKELRHLCLTNLYLKRWGIYQNAGDEKNAERCRLLHEKHKKIYEINPFQGIITLKQ